jgi:hypothetical protein
MSEHWARSCSGKRRYPSERRALVHAKATAIDAGEAMNAYACPFCPFWHVGSVTPHGPAWASTPRDIRNATYHPKPEAAEVKP